MKDTMKEIYVCKNKLEIQLCMNLLISHAAWDAMYVVMEYTGHEKLAGCTTKYSIQVPCSYPISRVEQLQHRLEGVTFALNSEHVARCVKKYCDEKISGH